MIPVNFENTLQTGKLDRDNNHFFSAAMLYIMIVIIGSALVLLIRFISDPIYFYAYIFIVIPAGMIVAGYLVWSKSTEQNMMSIPSPFTTETNKEIITAYLQKHEFETEYFEGDNLIATKAIDLKFTREMQLTIIFIEKGILVNVIGNYTDLASAISDQWYDYGFLLMSSSGVKKNIEWEIKTWGKSKEQYLEEWVRQL